VGGLWALLLALGTRVAQLVGYAGSLLLARAGWSRLSRSRNHDSRSGMD
jgi:hypothetical protein